MEITVQSFKIDGWEEWQKGLILAENDEWILVHDIVLDYMLDGFCLCKKEFVSQRLNGKHERFIERIFKLRSDNIQTHDKFEIINTVEVLKWVQEKFGLIAFIEDVQDELYIGTINRIIDTILIINYVDSNGLVEPDYDCEFDLTEIRAILFSGNYIEAVKALWLDENHPKSTS